MLRSITHRMVSSGLSENCDDDTVVSMLLLMYLVNATWLRRNGYGSV